MSKRVQYPHIWVKRTRPCVTITHVISIFRRSTKNEFVIRKIYQEKKLIDIEISFCRPVLLFFVVCTIFLFRDAHRHLCKQLHMTLTGCTCLSVPHSCAQYIVIHCIWYTHIYYFSALLHYNKFMARSGHSCFSTCVVSFFSNYIENSSDWWIVLHLQTTLCLEETVSDMKEIPFAIYKRSQFYRFSSVYGYTTSFISRRKHWDSLMCIHSQHVHEKTSYIITDRYW